MSGTLPTSCRTGGPQAELTAATLAQVKGLDDPIDIPQYPLVIRSASIGFVTGSRIILFQGGIEGLPDAETHNALGARAKDFGPGGDESESVTYGFDMEVSEEDESEKVFRVSWKKEGS
ncbi:hypothetical protein E4U58_004447 [Claviceps cyperi]|nr:hypothetical protein E4U58_004447 [Claviceps cyperi]